MCTFSTTTSFDGSNFTPTSVCEENAASGSTIEINIVGSGVTIIAVSSVPTLTWTDNGGTWTSSCLTMPTLGNSKVVNITLSWTSPLEARDAAGELPVHHHDPTFTVNNKTKC